MSMDGLYIGSKGMLSTQNHINSISNNVANVNSNGYKFDTMISEVFEEKTMIRDDGGNKKDIGNYQNKVTDVGTVINLKPGSVQLTDNPLDLMLTDKIGEGVSFFRVSDESGEYLTRDGSFQLNEERTLKTASGSYVLDRNGDKIQIPEGVDYTVGKAGKVLDSQTGDEIAQIQIRTITDDEKALLGKVGSNMFSFDGDIQDLPFSQGEVSAGMIERSNVDMSKELVNLMNAQRRFQAAQQVTKTFDGIYEKQANRILG